MKKTIMSVVKINYFVYIDKPYQTMYMVQIIGENTTKITLVYERAFIRKSYC